MRMHRHSTRGGEEDPKAVRFWTSAGKPTKLVSRSFPTCRLRWRHPSALGMRAMTSSRLSGCAWSPGRRARRDAGAPGGAARGDAPRRRRAPWPTRAPRSCRPGCSRTGARTGSAGAPRWSAAAGTRDRPDRTQPSRDRTSRARRPRTTRSAGGSTLQRGGGATRGEGGRAIVAEAFSRVGGAERGRAHTAPGRGVPHGSAAGARAGRRSVTSTGNSARRSAPPAPSIQTNTIDLVCNFRGMSVTDELLGTAPRTPTTTTGRTPLPPPAEGCDRRCMDARFDPHGLWG